MTHKPTPIQLALLMATTPASTEDEVQSNAALWLKSVHQEVNGVFGLFHMDIRIALRLFIVNFKKLGKDLYDHVVQNEETWRNSGFKNLTYFIHLCEFYMGRRSEADVTTTIEAL